jgi:predicted nucleic acid-binding Zn finger protein
VRLEQYPLTEVLADYCDGKAFDAFVNLFEKSDCAHVAAFRLALAERFADLNADEVDEFKRGEQ